MRGATKNGDQIVSIQLKRLRAELVAWGREKKLWRQMSEVNLRSLLDCSMNSAQMHWKVLATDHFTTSPMQTNNFRKFALVTSMGCSIKGGLAVFRPVACMHAGRRRLFSVSSFFYG